MMFGGRQMSIKVGIIGTGNMGGALIKGLCSSEREYEIYAYDLNTQITEQLAKQYSINIMPSVQELSKQCDVVVVAVKPHHMENVLKECKKTLSKNTVFVSVAVGLTIEYYTKILGEDKKIVRTMPNIAALVREGVTIVSFGDNVTSDEKKLVMDIFSCVGYAEELDESLMCQVTALTSSSPAYIFMMIEAMADAAVQSGIPRNVSYRLAAQAVSGSARMVLETQKHPAELKDMVCSPAGTTINAVYALEEKGFRSVIMTAMKECTGRAIEISRGMDK